MTAYLIRNFFNELCNPFMLGVLFLIGLLLYFFVHSQQRAIRICVSISLVGIYVLTTGGASTLIKNHLAKQYAVVEKANANVHWVVVLSGGMLGNINAPANHLLHPATIRRLVEGVRLYRQLPQAKLLLSGWNEGDGIYSAAESMRLLGSWFAVPEQNMVLEQYAMNTAEEAVAIKHWIKNEPFYLVTSAIHMPRAMALCRKQGLNPIAAPADFPYETTNWKKYIIPNPYNLVIIKDTWHELLGRVWEKWRGQA